MAIWLIFSMFMIHWVADFVLQTDREAKNKSTDMGYLLSHTANYTMCWFLPIVLYAAFSGFSVLPAILFLYITFVAHTVTDYITSRINSMLWKKGDSHNFFVSVGFDQVLHYVQLVLTFNYLFS